MIPLYIYTVSRTDSKKINVYTEYVVIEESKQSARKYHPNVQIFLSTDGNQWLTTDFEGNIIPANSNEWIEPSQISTLKINVIGTTMTKPKGLTSVTYQCR